MIQLDLTPDANVSHFVLRSSLDSKDYDFTFLWNERRGLWTLSMHTQAQEAIVLSRVLRHGRNLLSRAHSLNTPSGILFCWSNTPRDTSPPRLGDLGGRVGIYYASEKELAP